MKVIFFGTGSIGKRHLALVKESYPDCNFYAFKRHYHSEQFSGLSYLYSWDDVSKLKADLAFICNPTSRHFETAIECAKRGINLFIEKPVGSSQDGVPELLEQINIKKLKVAVGYNMRFHPVIEKARSFITSSGQKIISFSAYCGSYLPQWRSTCYRASYSSIKADGGGVILDLSHEIDYCKWLFGLPDKIYSAYGKYSSLDLDVEDLAEIIFQYDDKVGSIHLDYFRPIPRRDLEIITEASIFKGNLLSGNWSVETEDRTEQGNCLIDRDITYSKQLKNLMGYLHGLEEPRCSLPDALETLQLLLIVKGEDL